MSDSLPPLAPDLAALLRAERAGDGVPDGAEQRVLDHLEVVLGASSAWPPLPAPEASAPPAPSPPVAPSSAVVPTSWLGKPLAIGLAGFLAGVGATTALRPAPTASVVAVASSTPVLVAVTSPAPSTPDVGVVAPAVASTSAPVGSAPPRPSAPVATVATGSSADLAAEQTLLDIARTALGRGQPAAALDALQRHAARFPRGALREERASLQVQALAAAGRGQEARERAAAFHRQFPGSLQKDAVDSVATAVPSPAPSP